MQILYSLLIIFLILFILCLIRVTIAVTELLNEKTIQLEKKMTDSQINTKEAISNSAGLMNLINLLVEIEINNSLKQQISLQEQYKVTNIDNDIRNISTKIYNAIKPNIYDDNNIAISSEYIMTHITDEVTLKLIKTVQELNAQL